jgi:hypothetical protein
VRAPQERPWLPAALLVAAVLAVYLPVLQAGYIWDDDKHLTQNPCVIGPLGFSAIWTTAEATYYPLVLTTFWVGHALWGLAPFPFHLLNVLMHAACALTLWRVLLRLRVSGAWLGAALWALHPVNVESVAWVTELKNTQSGVFFLLAILFFLKWRNGKAPYVLALVCALAALLSKSSTVMLPVVLALCLWWEDDRVALRDLGPLVPFFALSAAVSLWTIWEQKVHAGASGADWAQTWPQRLVIAGRDPWFYLGKIVWPHPLVFIYPRWGVDASQILAFVPLIAAVAGLAALWWRRRSGTRPAFFAFAYFAISLLPVLSFFNVYYFRFSFVADHFVYLANMGPLALLGAGIAQAGAPSRRGAA